ncbi:MAG: hypothetical protein ACJATI_004709 [Halioglobus sp.]|jgi:hypothetical protein
MKNLYKLLLATMVLLCHYQNSFAFQTPSITYDLFFVGIDSDIDNRESDELILITAKDIPTNFSFGITNGISDNRDWITYANTFDYINITYIGAVPILRGSALRLQLYDDGLDILLDNKSIIDEFSISLSKDYVGNFINTSKWGLTVYSGKMTSGDGKNVLLGSSLDILAYGLTELESEAIVLPADLKEKDYVLTGNSQTIARGLGYENCDLCDILAYILFSENWLNLPNTYGIDLAVLELDIRDCITSPCQGPLVIDKLDCKTITVTELPSSCDAVKKWTWSKVIDGQLFHLESGDGPQIEDYIVTSVGLYQLTIECENGCEYASNLYYPDCFVDPCDFDIQISSEGCIASVTLTGCTNAQFQWYVQTDDGSFEISGATSSSVEADQNGLYYVIINGCSSCEEDVSSPSIEMYCGEECGCDVNLTQNECIISLEENGCEGYEQIFEYYLKDFDIWVIVNNPVFPYDPVEHGNGSYRITYTSVDCDETSDGIYIECKPVCSDCDDPCEIDLYLALEGCTLEAIVDSCEAPILQWQMQTNGVWVDITGATGNTFEVEEDGTFRFVVDGCGCTNEMYYSEPYTTNCTVDCCEIQLDISEDCIIESTNDGCRLILDIKWYIQEEDGSWTYQPQYTGNNISPNLNGTYKKVVESKDCEIEEATISIECVECNLMVWFTPSDDCTIIVNWTGCFEMQEFAWSYAAATGDLTDCSSSSFSSATDFEIINQSSNPILGTGSMEIQPEGEGCYQFSIICNDECEPVSVTEMYEACCSPHATIEYTEEDIEICDYCFVNDCTDSLFNIYVEINGTTIDLASYVDYFNFPYCDGIGCQPDGTDEDCGDLPPFSSLVSDINDWLNAFGYEGTAQENNGPGSCKGVNAPFWIEQTDVVFNTAYFYETLDWSATSSNGYDIIPFLEDNCSDTNGEPSIYVANACTGASFLWSTGSTAAMIPVQDGQSYSVTITCPDGCTTTLSYDNGLDGNSLINVNDKKSDSQSSQLRQDIDENRIAKDILDVQIYPNPTSSITTLKITGDSYDILETRIYNSYGALIKEDIMPRREDGIYKINLSNIDSGIYIIQIKSDHLLLSSEKIVIIK